ncbi:Alpha/Beta hydrolase protein [Armillaria luteobubalina]|uniref:Alpha/Beta hydrolase protein n=1 Tax=Armillaria luteobubalina TaxID=153913 RepID=A0AA39TVI0_9AGAR|nr:Alpha/Beta hydrolase protein [Armillaria luteobubalina]
MVSSLSLWVVLFLSLPFVSASPLEESVLHRRQSITDLTLEQAPCEANPDFKPVASGGNGDSVQFWYVGYDPDLDTVIVGHQGTDTTKLLPILTDINIILSNLDDNLFPGISSDIEVHSGFKEAQADAAESVLSNVKIAMSTYSSNSVTVVGHSLGGAIALLDGVYLDLQLPSATVTVISYGMPRVGNQAFANYVDANVNVTHVNNKRDPVPIVPLATTIVLARNISLTSNEWVNCPGQDNPDEQCIVGEVGNLLESNASDHSGPYDGIIMGGCQ